MSRNSPNRLTRRGFALSGLAAMTVTSACGNGVGSNGAITIDARVDATLDEMYRSYPNTGDIADKASGMLVMPLVTEAGFGFGAGYGRGALRVGGATLDYYSNTKATAGFQIGAQQYAHVLFFMTDEALRSFRRAPGWTLGADVGYVVNNSGESLAADSNTLQHAILAAVFNQAGLQVGATLEGSKYTRIIP
ncbi:MAG: YSC84-related protein [Paracoccaceae bacterium]